MRTRLLSGTGRELVADVVIVGGGLGGCAAALAAVEGGATVLLSEPTAWIGGQLTTQSVPPDEHGWIEHFGCTRSYRRLRNEFREYYRRHYPLAPSARRNPYLNPGNGWVSPLCHEPRVALAVLEALLAPARSAGRLNLLLRHELEGVDLARTDSLGAITLRDLDSGDARTVHGRFFLDATELGDLVERSGAESVTGTESGRDTGEPSAPSDGRPDNAQAFTMCCVVDHHDGEHHVIDRPDSYAFWREHVPALTPPWSGPLISWTAIHPRTLEPVTYRFAPNRERAVPFEGLWSYRRILDRAQFEPQAFTSDLCVLNWVMLDYCLGDLVTAQKDERTRHVAAARELTRSVVYWLQTEAPRPDGGVGWPGLRLRGDVTGSDDGLALAPYIRESRRIRALFTICEQHVAAACRPGSTLAESFPDSIGIGSYRIDLHPSTGGDNYIDVPALPFQIPLRALVPIRMGNLLPAAKNIGTTHITNGCYRLHPVEWNIGEVAGALAAHCVVRGRAPHDVAEHDHLLAEFQRHLVDRGVELAWPADLVLAEGDPH